MREDERTICHGQEYLSIEQAVRDCSVQGVFEHFSCLDDLDGLSEAEAVLSLPLAELSVVLNGKPSRTPRKVVGSTVTLVAIEMDGRVEVLGELRTIEERICNHDCN